ncbi:MAG: acetyl-CoA carboxylase biotin carboxyl carrier protein subunit [Bacteroidota bacterium]|nr:acetyl-CoA carboxylase biotin carboxyl carrier protein subunit [Bacteroidota bacterium]
MNEEQALKRLVIDDTVYETRFTPKFEKRKPYVAPNPNLVLAYIPGVIVDIHVKPGQRVKWGDRLLILEAMKMKNDIPSPRDGIVKRILVEKGQMVGKHQPLVEFE